ncbi:early boundary activity protein 1-like [Zeugodacus cucurbitae]|uniref:early boundary activity protein 1-like n=1 Tax=Zeugodacus cucurbitae TaxID=28588 RepID=UPI0023D95A2D|nr:early boundary activity protein 1-like [Zeugodacus cucurbitae]
MDLPRSSKINIKQENVESTEEALDLQTDEAILREIEDRNQQSQNESRQAKRRREFATYFNGGAKRRKRDEQESHPETPSSSSQTTHVITHDPHYNEDVIIKEESTEEENIAANLSNSDDNDDYVKPEMGTTDLEMGPHGTCVSIKNLESINWMEPSSVTSKLLAIIFDYQTLATHTLSGKPSPAFPEHQLKAQLNPLKVADGDY